MVAAVEEVAKHLHPGMLIILESTTYPGTTEELVRPILEATGLKAGRDFFLAFSPERVDPWQRTFHHRECAEGRRRYDPDVRVAVGGALHQRHRARRQGRLDSGGRDGENCWRTRSAR